MNQQAQEWDFFLAHAGADDQIAGKLYDLLAGQSRVFLDSRSLLPGDNWDKTLARAQKSSKVTVVIVSGAVTDAYYQREEVAAAINMARENETLHRVVPLYLPESEESEVPYGLRLKHSLRLDKEEDLGSAAEQLLNLLAHCGSRDASPNTNHAQRVISPTRLSRFAFTSSAIVLAVAFLIWVSWEKSTPTPIVLIEQVDNESIGDDAKYIGEKIQRNLAELLNNAGHRVVAPPFSVLSDSQASLIGKKFRTTISVNGGEISIHTALLSADESFITSTELNGPITAIKKIYKVLPEAILFGLDTDKDSLKQKNTTKRPTKSTEAYAYYLFARKSIGADDFEGAKTALERAISIDGTFALAHWSLGMLLSEQGESDEGLKHVDLAKQLDPDHARIAFTALSKQSSPVPDVMAAIQDARSTERQLSLGFSFVKAKSHEYGLEIGIWKVDPEQFGIRIIEQYEPQGSSVGRFLQSAKAILAINGGFFDIDRTNRLSPAGLLVVDEVIRNGVPNKQSGALVDYGGKIKIVWTKDLLALDQYSFVLQSGPILVEGSSQIGIVRNDYDRLNRAAVCSKDEMILFVVLHGEQGNGLSLYEFAELLTARESDGGLQCDLALNLDGGPSMQVAMDLGGFKYEVEGLWKVQNAIVVREK